MKILYAEDEKALSIAVVEILKMEGYEVDPVYDGEEATNHLNNGHYDAAILDIMMPKRNGIEVLSLMRSHEDYTPVMLLTAKSTTSDRIDGLNVGADDYLAKPFDMGELLARLDSMIRRATRYKVVHLSTANITLKLDQSELSSGSGSLRLSAKEAELLTLFMKNEGTTFTVRQLIDNVWPGEGDEATVSLYISYLKNKLGQLHSKVNIVQEANGYTLMEEE